MTTNIVRDVLENIKKVENLFITNSEGKSYIEPLSCKSGLYIYLEEEGYSLSFVATGEVEIYDRETKKLYKNDERFENKELMKSINDGTVFEKYEVKKENWFDIYIYDEKKNNGDVVEAFVFDKPIFSAVDLVLYLIDVLELTVIKLKSKEK